MAIEGETAKGRKKRLAASKRGSRTIKEEFAEHLTRKRFREAVGISTSTLLRWERAGIVNPTMIEVLGIPTRVFTEDEVALGKRIRALLSERPGELSLTQAADLARQP